MPQHRSYCPVSTSTFLAGFIGLTTLACANPPTSSISQPLPSQPQPKTVEATSDKANSAIAQAPSPSQSESSVASQPRETTVQPRETAVQPRETAVQQGKVISSVKADWNGDGIEDNAVLVESEAEPDQASLLIYVSESPSQTRLAVSKKNLVWRGAMYGTQPSLSLNPQGSLVITSANDAIGRDRWQQKITVMYDNSSFVVAGFTYTYRDTLDLSAGGTCDVNFLTRRGLRNNNEFRINTKPLKLADWTEDSAPKECRF